MLDTPEKKKAARRTPDGSEKQYLHDSIWQKIQIECSREKAQEQITSSVIDHPLPRVREARERDMWARYWLGLQQQDYRRRDFASALTDDQFRDAPRLGRRRRR